MAVGTNVKAFAAVAFTILGVLFGMQIMTFIFGYLGPSTSGLTIANPGYNESIIVQNNSLQGIIAYTAQTDTQMSVVAIAITLAILIAVFLIFWAVFVSRKSGTGSGGSFG